jgi:membrane-bound ClpP family serine protease
LFKEDSSMMVIIMALPILGLVFFYFLPFWTAASIYFCLLVLSGLMYFGMFTVMGGRRKVQTGFERMVDEEAEVIEDIHPEGRIRVDDEIWAATAHGQNFRKGERVRICGHEGMRLIVEALAGKEKKSKGT